MSHASRAPSTHHHAWTLADAQASLAWWAVVSPFAPYGPTLSLLFVLAVAAIKAIVEDRKRHQEDSRTNSSTAHVLHADGARLPMRSAAKVPEPRALCLPYALAAHARRQGRSAHKL